MPRTARVSVPDVPYHVTQRGNNRQAIFIDEKDYVRYIEWLRESCRHYRLEIWSYCLMINHVHHVVVPRHEKSMACAMHDTHTRYAQYFNRRYARSGHLWQGRYYSCALDERHLLAAVRYVQRNPVRSGLVNRAEDWRWSSAQAHLAGETGGWLSGQELLADLVREWRAFLVLPDEEQMITSLRRNTRSGYPLGDSTFTARMQERTSCPLGTGLRGRPRLWSPEVLK